MQRARLVFRSFSTAVNPDDVMVSVRLYKCGSDSHIIIKCSMNATPWSDVAILAFTFCSRFLFCVKHGRKIVLSRDKCRFAQWPWLKVRRFDAFYANQRIFLISIIDYVDELLQPYTRPKISWPFIYLMVPGRSVISYALSCSLLPGFEAAQHFLQSRQVPDNWKVDLSEILESSSSDDDDHGEGKEGEEEEKEPEPEEVRLQFHLFTLKLCFLQNVNLFIKC